MEHRHMHLFIYCLWLLLHYKGRIGYLWQRLHSLWSLKYLLSGPLRKKTANFWAKWMFIAVCPWARDPATTFQHHSKIFSTKKTWSPGVFTSELHQTFVAKIINFTQSLSEIEEKGIIPNSYYDACICYQNQIMT